MTSRNTRHLSVAAAVIVATLLATTGAAPASPAAPCPAQGGGSNPSSVVEYRFGGLSEAVLVVSVPVEKVRHLVPAGYRLQNESTGTTTIVAAFGSVDALTVGCSDADSSVVSEYGVFIDSPDGSSGRHAYYLWQLSDNYDLVTRMRMLGAPSYYADSAFSTVADATGLTIAAQTLWRESPNRLAARATEPGTQRGATLPGVQFWYDGPRGTVRTAYKCPDCLPRTDARGSVAAAPGTTLDSILGGQEQPGAGFFIRTDLTARAELLAP